MKEEMKEVLFKTQIADDTIVVIKMHVSTLQNVSGAQPILQKEPEENFPLILTRGVP
jgi:hypothetical protein